MTIIASRRHAVATVTAIFVSIALAIPGAASAAEILFATTSGNQLIQFTSQAPSRIVTREPIEGLATGEKVVGLDQRPATGQLYALTSAGRLLVVERSSGDTRAIGTPITLTGSEYGFDFDPVADRIRIVSNTGLNIRVNPDDATITADTALAYAAGDAGFGTTPALSAIGHTFSAFGAPPAASDVFGLDTGRDVFAHLHPANDGRLASVGALGIDAGTARFDIAGDNTRYAALAPASSNDLHLYTINNAGAATLAGTPSAIGDATITTLAAVGRTADDKRAPQVAVGNFTTWRGVWLGRGLRFTVACNEDCTVTTTLRINGTSVGTATASMNKPGTRAPHIMLSAQGRALAARTGRIKATLTFESVDLAGNERVQVSEFESLPGTNPVR